MASKGLVIGISVVIGILALGAGLFAYSYSQVHVSLQDISYAGIDWAPISVNTVVNAAMGNYLSAAISLIDGVKLELTFATSNQGILPVEIPDLSYDLFVNDFNVGNGQSAVNAIIGPGESKNIPVIQTIQKGNLQSAALSMVDSQGIMNIRVSGTAHYRFLGLSIPVPFQATKQISIINEINDRIGNARSGGSATSIYLTASDSSVSEGTTVTFRGVLTDMDGKGIGNELVYVKSDNSLWLDSSLPGVYTDGNGNFRTSWRAGEPHWYSNELKVYAVFEGSAVYSSARSKVVTVYVSENNQSPVTPPPATPPQEVPSPSTSQIIANSVYKVEPGTVEKVPFSLSCTARVQWEFSASAALGDDIIMLISSQTGGSGEIIYYNSGKVESGNWSMSLSPGSYAFIFDNTYSTFSTKTVTLLASSTCG